MATFKEKIETARKYANEESEFKNEVFLVKLLEEVFKVGPVVHQIPEALKQSTTKQLSIREFLNEKKPSSDVEKVLAMGYFLEKFESFISFNSDDLKNAFIKAKEPLPQNIHDKIYLNCRKGHITEYPENKDNKKAYHLTATGEKVVEEEFKGE